MMNPAMGPTRGRVIAGGVSLLILFAVIVGCVADKANSSSQVGDGDKTDDITGTNNGTEFSKESEDLFSTTTKVFLGIGALGTVGAIILCMLIKKKSENQYATGDNLPSPIVGLSSKF